MKKKILKGILSTILGITAIIVALGFILPISTITPYWIILSRSGFNNSCWNILLGNEHLYFGSPFTANLGTKAWNANDSVYGLKALEKEGNNKYQVYYPSYTRKEIKDNKALKQVGFFALRNHKSEEKTPFVINIAGGGFTSVCTMVESLPVSAKFQEYGYTSFALTYRISKTFGECDNLDNVLSDIAKSISIIRDKADEFNIDPDKYIITGFSAGAYIASSWCDKDIGYKKYNLPSPTSVNLLYGYNLESVLKDSFDIPTYSLLCKNDQYFNSSDYESIIKHYENNNINHSIKIVDCLHGFGLGTNTEAEGWVKDSLDFYNGIK